MDGDLELIVVAARTRLRLRVTAKAKHTALVGVHAGALKVSVTDPPEKGKANRAVCELIANALGLTRRSVTIVSGDASHDKVVLIPMPPEEIRARIRRSIR